MMIYSTKNNEKYIAYWNHTKYLVISSFFFMIPATYAFIHNLYLYSILYLRIIGEKQLILGEEIWI